MAFEVEDIISIEHLRVSVQSNELGAIEIIKKSKARMEYETETQEK